MKQVSVSALTERELALRRTLKEDFGAYAAACLKIRTKSGEVHPFRMNRSQRYLHERLQDQLARTGKVRALVLKGRQVGISTYIGGRCYWKVTHRFGVRAFILTHLDAASDNLFGMAKRFHDSCPVLVKPETGKANAKELSFAKLDSGYKVATAGSSEVGRSETIQIFHGSEVAFWPNAQNHAAGIRQAIANVPGTEVIFESTANGIGNIFHSEWKAAERGDSEYEAIFLPWFWHEEYATAAPETWNPSEAWHDYEVAYELTREQTYWAWLKNRELAVVAGGTSDEPCWQFKQEYPANADEAFQTSGANPFIKPETVVKARKSIVTGYGPMVLGVDPARGGGDKTGIIDRQGRRLGANVCKRLDSDDLMATAGEIQRIARPLMDQGLRKIVIDTTGLGAGLYDRLREIMGTDLVEGVNFASRAHDHKAYANRRAEMWDLMRQWMDDPAGVQVPDSDELQGDLCAPIRGSRETKFNSSGQLVLEAKDKIKERVSFSPDLGDAAALTFAVELSATENANWTYGGLAGPMGSSESWLGM
jgi:hypothetical protein